MGHDSHLESHLKIIDPLTDEKWEQFVHSQDTSLFISTAWLNVLRDTYGFEPEVLALTDHTEKLRSAICYVPISDFLGNRVVALPFSDHADPILAGETEWDELFKALSERFPGTPLTLRVTKHIRQLKSTGFTTVRRAVLHRLDLAQGFDFYWRNADGGSHRNAVRQAEKKGVEIDLRQDIDALRLYHQLHLSLRKGKFRLLAQPILLFERIWHHFFRNGNGFVLVAQAESRPIAAAVFLVWNDVLYYKFSASDSEFLSLRPNNLIIHEAARWATQQGLKGIDLGLSGESYTGLLRFKDSTGAQRRPLEFLQYVPHGADLHRGKDIRALFGDLTELLTRPDVPDDVTEAASSLLYRFFA